MENKQEHLQNIWLSNSFSSLQHFAQKQKAEEHSPQSFASFKWLSPETPASLWHMEDSLRAPDSCKIWMRNQWHSCEWEDEVYNV